MSSPKYNKSILNLYSNEDKVLARGFVPLANTIHLYKDELELTWKEIGLITSVLSSVFQNKPIIKDKDLSPDGKTESIKRDFRRQRNSLKAKDYLETKVIKDYKNGFKTLGIKYDFSGLWIKIKELVLRDEALNGNIEKPKEKNKTDNTENDTSPHLRCAGSEAALCVQSNRSFSGTLCYSALPTECGRRATEQQKSNIFLQEYNKLHKQIVGTELNLTLKNKLHTKNIFLNITVAEIENFLKLTLIILNKHIKIDYQKMSL